MFRGAGDLGLDPGLNPERLAGLMASDIEATDHTSSPFSQLHLAFCMPGQEPQVLRLGCRKAAPEGDLGDRGECGS